ncbi:rod shape-determining protein MreD [Paracoccus aerodenitrificans]|uniref:rod shape-determining protein MreD n=1 Tax=Paracoccus aerodenitrificans TaxID=3017781 RepID=UPI0022EFDCE0|nr:rod shape-determining protein MreD [Paracoccus aerodenitrificans]WBU62933.1 rod shape-determining protein MreD [Paracoccus aerodenitrificans]
MNGPLRHSLSGTVAFLLFGLLILFVRLMPLSPGDPGLPGADLTLCLSFAWVLRRPDQVPALSIAGLALIGDLLLDRPFGLWSFLLLIGTEMLRARYQRWSDQAFLFEWLRIAILTGLMMIGYRTTMILFLLPVPSLGPVVLVWLATVVAYPVVVMVLYLIGVRRLSKAELEMMVN